MTRKMNLRESAYAAVRKRMQDGEIGYQNRLVDYEIAEQLGMSRMPVREALLQLKNEGYLEGTARGFVLRQFSPGDIANIFEIRLLLEPHAAVEACQHVTMQGLGDMQLALEQAVEAHAQSRAVDFVHVGWRFRQAWVQMTPNQQLVQTIGRLRDFADLARLAALRQADYRAGSLARMQQIFEAFLHRDVAAVRVRIEENLRVCGTAYYVEQKALLASGGRRRGITPAGRTSAVRMVSG